MIKELARELLRSGMGRVSLVMLIILGGIGLYVILSFPGDFGKNIWNNPEHWADNPKSDPPLWTMWFDKNRAEHRVFVSSSPRVESAKRGENYIYRFKARVNPDNPPTFFSFSVSDIVFEKVPPIIEIYIEGQNKEAFLYRHIVAGARSDESLPVARYRDSPYRVNLTADKETKNIAQSFLEELATKREGDYYLKVLIRLGDVQDDVGETRVVIGGDAYGWLGTDNIGRDVFKGILAGLPPALLVGFLPAFLATWLGAVTGGISGYFGGKQDTAIQIVIDILMMLPILPLLIYLTFIFGPNIMFVVIILSLTGWIGLAKKLRPWIFQIRELGFIEYSRAKGFSSWRIIFRHILPQTLPLIFVYFSFFIPGAILAEAGLSLIGLGDPSIATWGQMLSQGFNTGAIFLGYWWWILPPGIAIVVTSLIPFLFFRSLEKAADPKLRRQE